MTKKHDDLLDLLEQGVRTMLADSKMDSALKLKAIEAGTRLLAIRHKIEGGGESGSFFGSSSGG